MMLTTHLLVLYKMACYVVFCWAVCAAMRENGLVLENGSTIDFRTKNGENNEVNF